MARTVANDIKALRTATRVIELGENQYFCQTPKAYEIWEEFKNGMVTFYERVKRIDRKRVLFVYTN